MKKQELLEKIEKCVDAHLGMHAWHSGFFLHACPHKGNEIEIENNVASGGFPVKIFINTSTKWERIEKFIIRESEKNEERGIKHVQGLIEQGDLTQEDFETWVELKYEEIKGI